MAGKGLSDLSSSLLSRLSLDLGLYLSEIAASKLEFESYFIRRNELTTSGAGAETYSPPKIPTPVCARLCDRQQLQQNSARVLAKALRCLLGGDPAGTFLVDADGAGSLSLFLVPGKQLHRQPSEGLSSGIAWLGTEGCSAAGGCRREVTALNYRGTQPPLLHTLPNASIRSAGRGKFVLSIPLAAMWRGGRSPALTRH